MYAHVCTTARGASSMSRDEARYNDKLLAEEAELGRSTIRDFEFISIAGKGCNGIAFIVRHRSPANPFAKTKTYVIKAMMNFGGLTSRGLRSSYQKEFDRFIELHDTRKQMQAAGKRDGLVQYYHAFSGKVPADMKRLVEEAYGAEFASFNFPADDGTS